jgi:hypothetical protein
VHGFSEVVNKLKKAEKMMGASQAAYRSVTDPKEFASWRGREGGVTGMARHTYEGLPLLAAMAALSVKRKPAQTFFHPDFTVGPGVSPDPGA